MLHLAKQSYKLNSDPKFNKDSHKADTRNEGFPGKINLRAPTLTSSNIWGCKSKAFSLRPRTPCGGAPWHERYESRGCRDTLYLRSSGANAFAFPAALLPRQLNGDRESIAITERPRPSGPVIHKTWPRDVPWFIRDSRWWWWWWWERGMHPPAERTVRKNEARECKHYLRGEPFKYLWSGNISVKTP